MDFLIMLIKVLVALSVILLLIYISARLGGGKLQNIQNGRYIKILERVPISKENSMLAVKIGEKAYVVSSTTGRIEIVKQISPEELAAMELSKNANANLNLNLDLNLKNYKNILNKFKHKKEDRDE
ncbi:MAG: flagellar biosynthetic protein FliO [Solirubrobacterales bacterium]